MPECKPSAQVPGCFITLKQVQYIIACLVSVAAARRQTVHGHLAFCLFTITICAMEKQINIRIARLTDTEALLALYTPYVEQTAITFELVPPSAQDFAQRVANTLKRYPYLVAECDNEILGYAYASAFRPRHAYLHAAETSIYIRQNYRGNGLGKRLYAALAQLLRAQNIFNMEACIAHCEPADEYVPAASRLFHEKMGFHLVGCFEKCGRKFNRWYDMIWMERILAEHPLSPEPYVPFPQLDGELVASILADA